LIDCHVDTGSKILVNYGYQVFTVKVVSEKEILTVADNDGSLAEHKVVHLQNKDGKKINTDLPLISEQVNSHFNHLTKILKK
jgi:pyruvate kinase